MPNDPKHKTPPAVGVRRPPEHQRHSEREAEDLRDQSKTETEQRPYLDTEGGE